MLKTWIPATKDFRDQGLTPSEWVNDNVTIIDGGKLGKCMSFDGSTSRLSTTNYALSNKWSFSCWVKDDSSVTAWQMILGLNTNGSDGNLQMGLWLKSNKSKLEFSYNGAYNSTIPYTPNQWNHFVGTYDGSSAKFYINGELKSTNANSGNLSRPNLTIGGRCSNTNGGHVSFANPFKGLINDVKIWDNHALSQKEISELKKMLILHYPLDGNNGTLANENLILNGAEANQSPASVNESTFTDYFYYSDYATELMSNNTTDEFTMSYDYEVYGAEPSGSNAVQLYAQCNNSIISKSLIKISSANEKGHVSFTFKLTSTQAQSTFSPFRTRMRLQLAIDGAYFIVKNVKLEKGTIATPWCPNPSDALYTALGYNDGIEYDTSGYKNNATGANNLSYSLDSPRYLASAVCNYSNGLTIPKIFSDTCNNQHMSFAFWLKRTADFEVYSENIYNGIAAIYIRKDYNNLPYRLFITWNHATDDSVAINSWTMYNTPLDTWVHIVITFNSGLLKTYVNGKLFATSDRTATGTYMQGNRGTSLGNITGQLSDFRIYATALSAEDIQKLYTVSASIDSNGNAYSNAFVE